MAAVRILSYGAVALLSLAGFRVLSSSLNYIFKFLINLFIGLLSIIIFNSAGRFAGVTLGINLFSGTVVGLCGPFGIVILLIMRLLTF